MKIRELVRFMRKMLKGRSFVTMSVCMLPLIGELFFRFAEAAVYALLLYFGELPPVALFSGESRLQLAAALTVSLLRLVVSAPLMYGAAVRLMETAGEKKVTPLAGTLMSRRNFCRSVLAALLAKLLGFATLVPTAFFGMNAYRLLMNSHTAEELFLTVHAFVLTAVSAGMWLALKISLSALPFLMAACPEKNIVKLTFRSVKLTSGRRNVLLRLIIMYLPLMASVVMLPFAVMRVMSAWALCISVCVKEDEYNERIKAESGFGQTDRASGVSNERLRSFTQTPDKAETSAGRDNTKRRDCPQY